MDKDYLFTIIVPVYNTEKYIRKCLNSILEAIDIDCEVIIVNDGSVDNSEKIALEFIENLPEKYKENFKYTKKENKGLADTKNVGLQMAKGKYISCVDSDDYISKDFYEIARKQINEGYEIIIYDVYVIFEKDKKMNYLSRAYVDYKNEFMVSILNGAISGSSCNKIIKKELYNNYKFPVGKEYEDTAVTPFILSETKKVKYMPYAMYYYLQREKSIVATNTLEEAFYKICENISEVIEEKSKENNMEEIADKYKYVINEFIIDRALEYFTSDYKLNKRSFINNLKDFKQKNSNVIDYIISKNWIFELENHYSQRQKDSLNQIFKYLQELQFNKIKKILNKRNLIRVLRNIEFNLKNLLKSIIGR